MGKAFPINRASQLYVSYVALTTHSESRYIHHKYLHVVCTTLRELFLAGKSFVENPIPVRHLSRCRGDVSTFSQASFEPDSEEALGDQTKSFTGLWW